MRAPRRCPICGAEVVTSKGHHATARGADGSYLDPTLVLDVCRWCHDEVHGWLRNLDLDEPASVGSGTPASLVARLLRLAVLLAFVGSCPVVVDLRAFMWLVSQSIRDWATEVAKANRQEDAV